MSKTEEQPANASLPQPPLLTNICSPPSSARDDVCPGSLDTVDKLARSFGVLSLDDCKNEYQEVVKQLAASYEDHMVDRKGTAHFISTYVIPVWIKTWKVLSQKDGSGVYPLFQSEEVKAYLNKVAWNVTVLEMRKPGLSLANGNSLLLTGPKGVGKTTLLYGAYRVTKQLCDNVLPVYHDYELGDFKVPKDLVVHEWSVQQRENMENEDSWVRYAYNQGHGIAFFGDEIQSLYVANASDTSDNKRARGESILRQILAIGKDGNAFGVLSGSASNVASLAFKKNISSEFAGFPNLNDSVYSERRVKPFRNLADLKAMVRERFLSSSEWDDDAVRHCFLATGGIGRLIDQQMPLTASDRPPLTSSFRTSLVNNDIFFHVASILHEKNAASIAENPFSQTSLSSNEIKAIFERHNQAKEWLRSVEQWIDASLVYEGDDGLYELLIPAHYQMMTQFLKEQPERQLVNCLQLLLDGYGKKGSPGGVVEEHIRKLIPDNSEELDLPNMVYGARRLSFAKKASDDENILYFKDLSSMDEIIGELFSLTKETGTDGLVIFKGTDGYEAHIFQMKFGQRGKSVQAGCFPPPENSTSVTLANVVDKADKGAQKITANLQALLKGKPLVFKSLTLLTSKVVPEDSLDKMKEWTWFLKGYKVAMEIVDKPRMGTWLGEKLLSSVGGL